MAVKTYQLNIEKSDGTSESVSFTIPDSARTYNLRFITSDGPYFDAGDITVDTSEHSYNLEVELSDGTTINAGTIVTPASQIPTFSDASWGEIEEISESGKASEYFAVGDEKTIELSTGEQVNLVILGFDHDEILGSSGKKAGMTIGMKNLLSTSYRMNQTDTNEGGWVDSEMLKTTMNAIYSNLPTALRKSIKRVLKKVIKVGDNTITVSDDILWLFSEVEIDGTTSEIYKDEGEQYEYWKTVKNGKNADDRIKYSYINGLLMKWTWWLRTPVITTTQQFKQIGSKGLMSSNRATLEYGVCFGFCI